MVMKAARSAEHIPKDGKDVNNSNNSVKPKVVRNVNTNTKSPGNMLRKQSSQSLQIPERVPLRRSISDTETRMMKQGSPEDKNQPKNASSISVTALLSPLDPRDNRKVTFSQVVDQMACSLSDSSSMSDLSSCGHEDFKHNVNASSAQVIQPTRSSRTGRKLFRSKRKHSHGGGGGSQSLAPSGSNQLSAYFPRHRRKWGTSNSGENGASSVSGSESNVFESSVDSLDNQHTTALTLRPLSALNPNNAMNSSRGDSLQHNTSGVENNNPTRLVGGSKLQKLSSADSLFSMIRNLASSNKNTSTPSSPQFSDINDIISSGFPTPLTTPDTPTGKKAGVLYSPRGKDGSTNSVKKKRESVPSSGSSSPASSPIRNQIMVEVVDPFNPRKDLGDHPQAEPDSLAGSSTSLSSASSSQPTITLEVPGFSFGKCLLSPIKELPSPMPTPLMSPVPFHHRVSVSSLGSHSSSPIGDDTNFPNEVCSSCGGCGRSPNKSYIAIVRPPSSAGDPRLSPSSSSTSSSDSTSNSSRRSRILRKSFQSSKDARIALENAMEMGKGGYSPGVSESIEMEEINAVNTPMEDEITIVCGPAELDDDVTIEIPTVNVVDDGHESVSPSRRASYEETTIIVPIAVVQRRPSLVATMDAERQERLRKDEQRKKSLSSRTQPSIPVITVTCDDSDEGEEDEVSDYGFMPLEECNSLQDDSLEFNGAEFETSIAEGIEDIPCVNIIPPSLPQSPQMGEPFETEIVQNCFATENEVNEQERDETSNSTMASTSSCDPTELDDIDKDVEKESSSNANLEDPCTFVVTKSTVKSVMKMEAVVVELPLSTSSGNTGNSCVASSGNSDTTCSSAHSSSSTSSSNSIRIAVNNESPNLPKHSSPKRKRPPPLKIPNSNFLNFGPSPQETKNVTMDTMSRPCSRIQKGNTPSKTLMTSKELGERRSQTPTLSSMEPIENSSSTEEQAISLTKQPCIDIVEETYSFKSTESVATIPCKGRQSLVKQQGIIEENDDPNLDDKSSVIIKDSSEGIPPILHSPSFLLSSGKFDSTPRERSQSVQYSEGVPLLESQPGYKPNISPNIKSKADRKRELRNMSKMGNVIAPNNQIVSLMIQPPTPHTTLHSTSNSNLPNDLHRAGSYSRAKPTYRTRAQFSPMDHGNEKKGMTNFDFSNYSWTGVTLGSPPPMRKNTQSSNGMVPQTVKPKTLDIVDGFGPSITITPMSELESDADSSPNLKDARSMSCFAGNISPNPGSDERNASQASGMQYLSPFTITVPMPTSCSSNSRTTSDSNLSSSGYSSMASPGPSRSGSFNPIHCASESEDASSGTPTKLSCGGGGFQHHYQHHHPQYRGGSSQRQLPQQPPSSHIGGEIGGIISCS